MLSLIKANRQILRANKISENIDDFIYLTVMLKQSLVECAATEQPPRPTPVQIRLPTPLVYRDALLICNQGKRENQLSILHDAGFSQKFTVLENTKDLKPSELSKYDVVLAYDNLKLPAKV